MEGRNTRSFERTFKGKKVFCQQGDEGPMHDPYMFNEYSFVAKRVLRSPKVVTLHLGLGDFLIVDEEEVARGYENVEKAFKKVVRCTIDKFLRSMDKEYQKSSSRCPKCGSKNLRWVEGFPGESLLMCDKCNEVVQSQMNWGAIE